MRVCVTCACREFRFVGGDSHQECSGMEAPLFALRELGIKPKHLSSTEIYPPAQRLIFRNFNPDVMFSNILSRRAADIASAMLYAAGFPCKALVNVTESYIEVFENFGPLCNAECSWPSRPYTSMATVCLVGILSQSRRYCDNTAEFTSADSCRDTVGGIT